MAHTHWIRTIESRMAGRTFFGRWSMIQSLLGIFGLFLAVTALPAQQSLILNGGMEEGTEKPAGWTARGGATIARDSVVYKSQTASLRLDVNEGSGAAYQKLDPTPANEIKVRGSGRVEGTFEVAQVAFQSFDASNKQIGWKVISILKPGAEWTDFQTQFLPPPSATSVLLLVVGKGAGQIWLDDVSVEGSADSAPATPTSQVVPEIAPLPMVIPADSPLLHYSGRFDITDPKAPRCAWSASTVRLRFKGTAANVSLQGSNGVRWQAYVNGQPGQVLVNNGKPQLLSLAKDLPEGEHDIVLLKRTEASVGTASILGFQINQGGELMQAKAPPRRIEVIGDSISAGFGNEAADQNEKFSPATENAGIAYGALAARALDAEYVCVAWSGRKLWPDKTIPEVYDRIIPQETDSKWDFGKWKPEVVVINLGSNDFSGGNPEEEGWTTAYREFIARVRKNYPEAYIFCAISPMMSDVHSKSKDARTTIIRYVNRVIEECGKAGETKVALLEFPTQTGALGFGAQWHPSARQHEAMAAVMEKAIREKLGW